MSFIVKSLRYLLIVFYWVCFMPFYEVFLSIFKCDDNNYHYLVTDMACFQSQHIILCILSGFGLLFLLSLNAIIALLYNETQPVKEDAFSRLESTFEIMMLFYRIFIATFGLICHQSMCSWVLIIIYLGSSIFLSYQYFIFIPYYNSLVSVFFGSLINLYLWISLNCLLTKLVVVNGHIIILLMGVPLIIYLVYQLRQRRIDLLLDQSIEKINNDVDALIQISTIKDLSIGKVTSNKTSGENMDFEMKVKGIINLHVEECKLDFCLCKNQEELYDVSQQAFLTPQQEPHNEPIFVYHYNKKLFDDALNKFIQSPNLHISFSYYLFSVMRNIHAALHELNIANKKKPNVQQQFTIFRYKKIIEHYIQSEAQKTQNIYKQLTNVKEFERLHQEMSKSIEQVCNFCVEFWSHLTTAIPDLNVLNDLGNKIHEAASQADAYWNLLIKINPKYPGALQQYGEYLSLIRNHPQIGKPYIENAQNFRSAVGGNQTIEEVGVKSSEILFTEDTTVVHISGNKESSGRVVKVSHGLQKCFGYSKDEVVGHNINFLMPGIIGIRHNDFLDKFYRTGRERVFNHERMVFAQNKYGHCFNAKVLVKQMPSLKEGIQYVGMIRPAFSDHDYIITDLNGNIDCFSKGITSLVGLNPQLFKENNQINIMLLCPELIDIFEQRRKLLKIASQINPAADQQNHDPSQEQHEPAKQDPDSAFQNTKLAQQGGTPIALIVPQNFAAIAKSEKQQKQGRGGNSSSSKNKKSSSNNNDSSGDLLGAAKINRSNQFREFLKYLQKGRTYTRRQPDVKKLLMAKEYKENEKFRIIQCELKLNIIKVNRGDQHALRYLVFMINKTNGKKKHHHDVPIDGKDGNDPDVDLISVLEDQDQSDLIKNASPIIQEVFGTKDELSPTNNQQNTMNRGLNLNSSLNMTQLKNQSLRGIQSLKANEFQNTDQQSNMIDIRRENQQMAGFKKVGFADEMKSGTIEKKRMRSNSKLLKVSSTDGGNNITNAITFIGNDEELIPEKTKSPVLSSRAGEGEDVLLLSKRPQEESKSKVEKIAISPAPSATKSPQDKETPRIDVKKDISLNENIKKKTASLNDSIIKRLSGQKFNTKQGSIEERDEPSSSRAEASEVSSSHHSNKQSLKQMEKPVGQSARVTIPIQEEDDEDDQKRLLTTSKDQQENSSQSINDMEEYEEEIEEIIEEEIEEDAEDEDYNQENMDEQQELLINQQDIGQYSAMKNAMYGAYGDFGVFSSQQQQSLAKKKKIRDYEKIVTNPRYKSLDIESCGSEYFKDWDFTNDEIEIRDMIKKCELRKKRRERRMRKMMKSSHVGELKPKVEKIDEEKKEEEKSIEDQSKNEEDEVVEEDEDKKEEDSEEEDKDDDDSNSEHKAKMHIDIDEGEVSSIASSIFSQTRSYYSLRNSIDEKFTPFSIRNLKVIANIVFISLLTLDIVQFTIQQQLFHEVSSNLDNMHYSEQRIRDIIDMNLRIQNLRLVNEGIMNGSYYEQWGINKSAYINQQTTLLINSATALKDSQTILSQSTSSFDVDQRLKINPSDVLLKYESGVKDMPSLLMFNIWESIIKIQVAVFQLGQNSSQILTNATTTQFVQENCLNSILGKLKQSTQAIVQANDQRRGSSINLFLNLLVAVSCALVIALGFLLPVISRAKKSKQEVLKLFLHKKIEKCIDDQLKLCRWFISKYQVQNESQGVNGNQAGGGVELENENEDNIGGMNEKELKKEKEELLSMKRIKKKKKWRPLNFNFGFLTIRLVLIVCILEGFFLATYLFSKIFMEEVSELTTELQLLISRQPLFTLVLFMQKELFYTNGTAQIFNTPVAQVLKTYNEQLIDEQQTLLEIFSANYKYHTNIYNQEFTNLVYGNMCDNKKFDGSTLQECKNFNLGILEKGMYSTITKYLSQLKQIDSQFNISRNTSNVKNFINNQKLVLSERTCDLYMKQVHEHLIQILEQDIATFFSNQFKQDIAIFIVFLCYLFFIYFFVWRIFLRRMLDELWRAKSMLSILPVEVCFKIEEIRQFIYQNSSSKNLGQ